MHDSPIPVLAHYGISCPPTRLEARGGAGGFSGARFWKVLSPGGPLCLRRWPPEHPSLERLRFIHSVLRHVAEAGCPLVPVPLRTASDETFVGQGGCLWELARWMPGEADFRRAPSAERLAAALSALAEFHRAAAGFPLATRWGRSPGTVQRRQLLGQWLAGGTDRLAAAVTPLRWPELAQRAGRILAHFQSLARPIEEELERANTLEVPLEPCLRDIWQDHVLYVGPKVSGLVDFGSMDVDNLSTDIARLLGSMAGDDPELRRIGLAAFEQVRPLDDREKWLIGCFDRSTVLMSGLNWLKWVYLDRREFDDPPAVVRRIDEILVRLELAVKSTLAPGGITSDKSR